MSIKPKCNNKFGIRNPVQHISQEEIDAHLEQEDKDILGVTTPGWYFWDETWSKVIGPYPSGKLAQAAYGGYGDYLNNEVAPPDDDQKIIIQLKGATEVWGMFEGLYTKETNSVYVACVSKAFGDYQWDQIARWWPFPSAKDLDFVGWKHHIEDFLECLHKGQITCIECAQRNTCKYRWDFYNSHGDCLADK